MLHNWLNSFNKFFDIDNKTTVPVLITLFVFLLTQLLTTASNAIKDSRKRKTIKRIVKKNLLEFTISLKKETNNSFITSEIFKNRRNTNFTITKNSFSQLSVFTEIGYQELFNTFYKGIFNRLNSFLKMHAVSTLWSIIISIKEREEYSKAQLEIFNDLNNKQIGLFNKSHQAYMEYIYGLLMHRNSFQTENEQNYVIELEQIHSKWHNTDNFTDSDVVYEKLVKPSDDLNRKYTNITDHLTLPSLSILQEMDLNYRNRKHLLQSYSRIYIISNNFYLMSLRRIEVINSILFPSFKLSVKRICHYWKMAKNPKKSNIPLRFIPEVD
ncbi:MAG: hypothetical protein ACHQIM_02520 [Sphingobacteriales bacterium]